MGYSKSSPKREVNGNKCPPQEIRKVSNKQPNFTPQGHYAKWNKWDREIPYDLSYMWDLESKQTKPKLIDTEDRLVAARGEG